jgi:hypothetical protein
MRIHTDNHNLIIDKNGYSFSVSTETVGDLRDVNGMDAARELAIIMCQRLEQIQPDGYKLNPVTQEEEDHLTSVIRRMRGVIHRMRNMGAPVQ